MSYTRFDFPTKKALRTAVDLLAAESLPSGETASPALRAQLTRNLTLQRTSIAGDEPTDGIAFLEGPQYPKPHAWYAKVQVKDGVVVKVLS